MGERKHKRLMEERRLEHRGPKTVSRNLLSQSREKGSSFLGQETPTLEQAKFSLLESDLPHQSLGNRQVWGEEFHSKGRRGYLKSRQKLAP